MVQILRKLVLDHVNSTAHIRPYELNYTDQKTCFRLKDLDHRGGIDDRSVGRVNEAFKAGHLKRLPPNVTR